MYKTFLSYSFGVFKTFCELYNKRIRTATSLSYGHLQSFVRRSCKIMHPFLGLVGTQTHHPQSYCDCNLSYVLYVHRTSNFQLFSAILYELLTALVSSETICKLVARKFVMCQQFLRTSYK